MKNILLLCPGIFLAIGIYSQNHFIDIRGGMNASTIVNYADDQNMFGPAAGLGYEFRFAKIMSLQTGLMYNQRGGMYQTTLVDNAVNQLFQRHYPVRAHYLSMPIQLGLVSTGDTYGFGRFGTTVSYLLEASFNYPEYENGAYVEKTRNINHRFHRFDVVGVIEGGMGGAVGDRFVVEGAIGMQVGLSNAVKRNNLGYPQYNSSTNTIELPSNPHFGFSVMLALKYKLGSKASE